MSKRFAPSFFPSFLSHYQDIITIGFVSAERFSCPPQLSALSSVVETSTITCPSPPPPPSPMSSFAASGSRLLFISFMEVNLRHFEQPSAPKFARHGLWARKNTQATLLLDYVLGCGNFFLQTNTTNPHLWKHALHPAHLKTAST